MCDGKFSKLGRFATSPLPKNLETALRNRMMQRTCFSILTLLFIFSITFFSGCQKGSKDNKNLGKASKLESDHSHDNDVLTWVEESPGDVYHISVGYHGNHFHVGDTLEPAVMVVAKDGSDVSNLRIRCKFTDRGKMIGEEGTLVFEPKTETEPAHYAQHKFTFPDEEKMYTLKFAIELPGSTLLIPATVECGH